MLNRRNRLRWLAFALLVIGLGAEWSLASRIRQRSATPQFRPKSVPSSYPQKPEPPNRVMMVHVPMRSFFLHSANQRMTT